ncbi:hypothetical protein MJH12_04645, partial [bacterium]|nr:hypothetical protein [bacterium]
SSLLLYIGISLFSFQSCFILSVFLVILLWIQLCSKSSLSKIFLPLAICLPFLSFSYLEFKSKTLVEDLGIQENFQPEYFSNHYLNFSDIENLITGKHQSVLFPLSTSPLIYHKNKIRYSNYWKVLFLKISLKFPVFYIFKSGEDYWFYGNKVNSFKSFFTKFKGKINQQESNTKVQSKLSKLLLHQVISFDGMAHDKLALSKEKLSNILLNPFNKQSQIKISEYHKRFPYLIYKELFNKQSTSYLYSPKVLQKTVLSLIEEQEYILAENLIYFYFVLYGMDQGYYLMTTMLSTVFLSPQTSIALLMTQDPNQMEETLLFQSFKLFEYQEKIFTSYGKPYLYEPMITCLKKLQKDDQNISMYITNKLIKYSRLSNLSQDFSGCGCSDN